MKTVDILELIRKNKPLPEGCTIGGYADLRGYNFALPEGCTIGGDADLRGYNFALPEGCIKKRLAYPERVCAPDGPGPGK